MPEKRNTRTREHAYCNAQVWQHDVPGCGHRGAVQEARARHGRRHAWGQGVFGRRADQDQELRGVLRALPQVGVCARVRWCVCLRV